MRSFVFFLIVIFSHFDSLAQEAVLSFGEYQSEIFSNESVEAGKLRIREGAILNALEKAYGVAVFQGNNLYVSNKNTREKTESKTLFTSYGETYVKGELLEVLTEKFTQLTFEVNKGKKGKKKVETQVSIEWKCEVTIKCREYQAPVANFKSYTLNCPDTNSCRTTTFKNEESLFLYFSSPQKGYVSVFLDDNSSAVICLPYVTNRQNYMSGFPVEGGKQYIFFEDNKSYYDNTKTRVDELEWETRENLEKMTVIFSPYPFELPEFNAAYQKYVPSNYNLPDNLPSEDFNKWLINVQTKRKDIEIMRIYLNTSFDR